MKEHVNKNERSRWVRLLIVLAIIGRLNCDLDSMRTGRGVS